MNKKTIHTGGKPTPGLPFQGEMMVCESCSKQQKSNPKVESGWTTIDLDDKRFYFCPECFEKLMAGQRVAPKRKF